MDFQTDWQHNTLSSLAQESVLPSELPPNAAGAVMAWEQPVVIWTYPPVAPDPNPLLLEKRVSGFTKVCYRGLKKNHEWPCAAFAAR